MSAISPIEHAIHTTNIWLKDLDDQMGWNDRLRTYHALRVVLDALRDRLSVAEAVDLGAQLPMLIRGMYYEGWTPVGKPVKERTREEFLAHVTAVFESQELFPEGIVWGVFRLPEKHVSAGEIRDIKQTLRHETRLLWPGERAS